MVADLAAHASGPSEVDRKKVIDMFRESSLWRAKIVEDTILPRLMKRFAMAGSQKDYQTCVELFKLALEGNVML